MVKYLRSRYWIGYMIFVPFVLLDNVFTAELLERIFNFVYKPEYLNISVVIKMFIVITSMFFVIAIGIVLTKYFESKIIQVGIVTLKEDIVKHMIYSHDHLENHLSLLLNDLKILENDYFKTIFEIGTNIFILIISTLMILSKNVKLGLILIIGTFIPIIFTNRISRPIVLLSSLWENAYQNYTKFISQMIDGIVTIQNYNVQPVMMNRHNLYAKEVGIRFIKLNVSREMLNNISVGLTFAITISSQLYGIYLVSIQELTIGEILAIIQLSNSVTFPLMNILENYTKLRSTTNIQKRINDFISSDIEETYDIIPFCHFIECHNVSYEVNHQQILNNIDLKIHKGEKILILGKNGSGKSTLFHILQGRIKPTHGEVMIDHFSYNHLKQNTLYNLISYVPQNVFVFDDTIDFNITFAHTNDSLYKSVIQSTYLETVIKDKGNNYIADSQNNSLSGGEKQRIEIARALYFQRPILMMDESFSAIDKNTAKEIEKYILLQKEKTIISIAHTMSIDNIKRFNKVIVLEKGRIKEVGTPQELLDQPNSFVHSIVSQ